MTRLRLALLVAVFASLQLVAGRDSRAQSPEQSPARAAPTGITLEITNTRNRPPNYMAVPGRDSEPRGGWFSLFDRVAGWRPPEGTLPTRAVNVVSRQEGDFVRVVVSVLQGVKLHEKESFVVSHLMRVGEPVEVRELTRFGVGPFRIKVVRVGAVPTNPPAVTSAAPSIAATASEVVAGATLPKHKVSVRNLSAKDVTALGVAGYVNGKWELSTFKTGEDGARLIEAGGAYEFEIPGANEARPTPEGFAPAAPPNQEVRITAAVFADGSTEGDPAIAASHKSYAAGRRTQLARLIPILQGALASADEADAAKRLHERASALDNTADAAELDALAQEFPTLDRERQLRLRVEVAMSHVRVELLKEVGAFAAADLERPGEKSFRAWLGAKKERLERWLAKL